MSQGKSIAFRGWLVDAEPKARGFGGWLYVPGSDGYVWYTTAAAEELSGATASVSLDNAVFASAGVLTDAECGIYMTLSFGSLEAQVLTDADAAIWLDMVVSGQAEELTDVEAALIVWGDIAPFLSVGIPARADEVYADATFVSSSDLESTVLVTGDVNSLATIMNEIRAQAVAKEYYSVLDVRDSEAEAKKHVTDAIQAERCDRGINAEMIDVSDVEGQE